jgi:hypothetical protein
MSWCLNPDAPARATGEAVWHIFCRGLYSKK